MCLRYGPMSDGGLAESGTVYHPQVLTYIAIGLSVLVFLIVVEHADALGWSSSRGVQYFVLPFATGLGFGLEKVFNTEMGYLKVPETWADLQREPLWATMGVGIALLGLTDFYLNLRGAKRLPVKVFVPGSFALATAMQFVQSVTLFGEFKQMTNYAALLSISGACLSLLGAMCIQPLRLFAYDDEAHQLLPQEDPQKTDLHLKTEDLEASLQLKDLQDLEKSLQGALLPLK
ncbi:unnamed protein product, partial [Polarella glacialis]